MHTQTKPWPSWEVMTRLYLNNMNNKHETKAQELETPCEPWPQCHNQIALEETGFTMEELLHSVNHPEEAPDHVNQERLNFLEVVVKELGDAPVITQDLARSVLLHASAGDTSTEYVLDLIGQPDELEQPDLQGCQCQDELADLALPVKPVWDKYQDAYVYQCTACGRVI